VHRTSGHFSARYIPKKRIGYLITEIRDKDPLTERIIACAYKVHSELGPGFNEGIYHNALKIALEEDDLRFETEKSFYVSFQGKHVGKLRLDLIIEDKVIPVIYPLCLNYRSYPI
jgi:hypothetical protein